MRIGLGAMLVALAVGLAACGGTGGGGSTAPGDVALPFDEDEIAIRTTITMLSKVASPGLCTSSLTRNWIDDSYPPAGEGALDECRSSQRANTKLLAERVRFEAIEIDGNEATATFEELGRDIGGSRSTVRLLQDGEGTWRVEELVAVEITDSPQFLAALRASATYGPGAVSGAQADCLVSRVERIPSGDLERRAISGDRGIPVPIVADCLGDGSARAAAIEIVRRALHDRPRFADHAECAAKGLDRVLNDVQARDFIGQEDRTTIQLLTARVLAACGAVAPLDSEESVA